MEIRFVARSPPRAAGTAEQFGDGPRSQLGKTTMNSNCVKQIRGWDMVWLNQLPTHGADDRVQVHGRDFVPDGLHVLDAGCT